MQASLRMPIKRFCIDPHNVEINWQPGHGSGSRERLFAKRSRRCVLLRLTSGISVPFYVDKKRGIWETQIDAAHLGQLSEQRRNSPAPL